MKLMRAMALYVWSAQLDNDLDNLSPLKAHPYPPVLVRSFSATAV